MKRLVLSPSSLPTSPPLNTVLWWLLATEVYKMPWWLEAAGWGFLGMLVLLRYGLRLGEQRIDIFEKYRERKDQENEKPTEG